MNNDLRALILTACVLVFVSGAGRVSANEIPSPILGPTFPANDLVPPFTEFGFSSDDEATPVCVHADESQHHLVDTEGDLFVEHRTGSGEILAASAMLNAASAVDPAISCNRSGTALVTWTDLATGCPRLRFLDAELAPLSEAVEPVGLRPCPSIAGFHLTDDHIAWILGNERSGISKVFATPTSITGAALTSPQILSETRRIQIDDSALIQDGAGHVALAWTAHDARDDVEHFVALSRSDGLTLSRAQSVAAHPVAQRTGLRLAVRSEGRFEIGFFNLDLGGWLGRIATTPDLARSAPVATLPAASTARGVPPGAPVFTNGPILATPKKFTRRFVSHLELELEPTANVQWNIRTTGLIFYTNGNSEVVTETQISPSDGRFWEEPTFTDDSLGQQAGSASSTRIAARTEPGCQQIEIRRSTDAGVTWGPWDGIDGAINPICDPAFDRARHRVVHDGAGNWLVVYETADSVPRRRAAAPRPAAVPALKALRSDDDGITWSAPVTVASPVDSNLPARSGLYHDLAMDSSGTAVSVWRGSKVEAARSSDGGATWSAPVTIAAVHSLASRPGRGDGGAAALATQADQTDELWSDFLALDLETDGAGTWVLAFATAGHRPETYGVDTDVFVSRSEDGLVWSMPAPAHPWADTDGATDIAPSLAFGQGNQWLLVWTSFRPLGDPTNLDADIAATFSTDSAISWGTPYLAHSDAVLDEAGDRLPALHVSPSGTWFLASVARDTFGSAGTLDDVRISAAWTSCGNGVTDEGEFCDPEARNSASTGPSARGAGDCAENCTAEACGNGIREDDEECDDGNESKRDACTKCKATVCGDKIRRTETEECDDGNLIEGDGCDANCREELCGNGVIEDSNFEQCDDGNFIQGDGCSFCLFEECGNGVRQHLEPCDDGNDSNVDSCLVGCVAASCGDGFLHDGIEICDDGNSVATDLCTNACRPAACGDSVVHAPTEECDDGNNGSFDACVDGCRLAKCGDGLLQINLEECDDGNSVDGDECTNDCLRPDVCADPTMDGKTTASDALHILTGAVDPTIFCPRIRCDLNNDGTVTAGDALGALRLSVDLEANRACPRFDARIGFQVISPEPLGSLQFDVRYQPELGGFGPFGEIGSNTACVWDLPGVFVAVNDKPPGGNLAIAAITLSGISPNSRIATCTFTAKPGVVASPVFEIVVIEASSLNNGQILEDVGIKVVEGPH